jgi:hypothetical protein
MKLSGDGIDEEESDEDAMVLTPGRCTGGWRRLREKLSKGDCMPVVAAAGDNSSARDPPCPNAVMAALWGSANGDGERGGNARPNKEPWLREGSTSAVLLTPGRSESGEGERGSNMRSLSELMSIK